MKKFKFVIIESEDCGVENIVLTDSPMCGVMGVTFSDTKQTTIEIKDIKENDTFNPSSKPLK